jgi:ABC-type nitrate/sulfonate/bicarbonate transport system ATPase subunit
VVFVTHDVDEAIYLADEVHVMASRPGRIVESIPVPLARPRLRATVLSSEFLAIKQRCLELLAGQTPETREAAE